MKRTITVLLVLSGFLLSGCNTVHGFGKDVEKVGEKVQGK
ncbi:entericidin A [Actimicrobium sp. GrIS 1.19]|jgi:entericidin A|nr:entericidin A [Actimicrobium sp. GrIS 1.19]